MNNIKMTLIGMLVIMAFVVTPVYAQGVGDGTTGTQPGVGQQDRDLMGQQEGKIQASELMDKQVHDQQGNEIGNVSDLVSNQQGEVEFLVISEGTEFLGLGEEDLIPIPWDMVQAQQFRPDDDAITIALDEQALRDAPTFTNDDWEAFTQGEMDQEVRGYYDQHGPAMQERDQWQQDQQPGAQPGTQPGQDQQEEYENERDPDPMEGPDQQ
jgi:sporulation protein YlmC with PRC-barrel domain